MYNITFGPQLSKCHFSFVLFPLINSNTQSLLDAHVQTHALCLRNDFSQIMFPKTQQKSLTVLVSPSHFKSTSHSYSLHLNTILFPQSVLFLTAAVHPPLSCLGPSAPPTHCPGSQYQGSHGLWGWSQTRFYGGSHSRWLYLTRPWC